MPAKRSTFFREKPRVTFSWSCDMTFTQNRPARPISGHVPDVFAGQTETSGGSSDTDVKELHAMPTTPPPAVNAVITVQPVGRWPSTLR